MISHWQYSSAVDQARQNRLLAVSSFYDVVDQIEKELTILCYHTQHCDDAYGYARSVFCIRVPEEVFDIFFNSPSGYRANYFSSPSLGLQQNHFLIQRLFLKLSLWAQQSVGGYSADFAQKSMLSISSKAWLAECSMEICDACKGEWSASSDGNAEISNSRWEQSSQPNSRYGIKAPLHTKIRLFGAFLNNRGDEFIPARKRDRDKQIHDTGWS